MRLTKPNLSRLALSAGKSEAIIFDETMPGFGVRIRAGGKRVWLVQFRIGDKQRRITLGPVDVLDPDEAKKRAKSALAKVQLGQDPATEKFEARAQASLTLGVVSERYLDGYAKKRLKPKSLSGVTLYLNQHWATLAEMPANKIKRADVAARLVEIANEKGPSPRTGPEPLCLRFSAGPSERASLIKIVSSARTSRQRRFREIAFYLMKSSVSFGGSLVMANMARSFAC